MLLLIYTIATNEAVSGSWFILGVTTKLEKIGEQEQEKQGMIDVR